MAASHGRFEHFHRPLLVRRLLVFSRLNPQVDRFCAVVMVSSIDRRPSRSNRVSNGDECFSRIWSGRSSINAVAFTVHPVECWHYGAFAKPTVDSALQLGGLCAQVTARRVIAAQARTWFNISMGPGPHAGNKCDASIPGEIPRVETRVPFVRGAHRSEGSIYGTCSRCTVTTREPTTNCSWFRSAWAQGTHETDSRRTYEYRNPHREAL